MTLSEFVEAVRREFPKAEFTLGIDASYSRTPAHTQSFLGRTTSYPEKTISNASYRLSFTPDFFLEDKEDEQFAAPSLRALWEILTATYVNRKSETVHELEDWLQKQPLEGA